MARDARRAYRARVRLARERGFASYWAERRAPRILRRTSDLSRLPEAARESRAEASEALAIARRERISIEDAARRTGTSRSAVGWWFPDALSPTRHGRTVPLGADRALRLRPLVVEGEVTFVATRGSRAADRARDYFDVQWRFVHGEADVSELEALRGKRVAGRLVESDPAVLERLGYAYAFDIDAVYRGIVA